MSNSHTSVNVHCNTHLIDKIEKIIHNNYDNIEWSSENDMLE